MKLVSKSSVFNQSFVSIQIVVVLFFGIFNNVKLTNATSLHRDVNQEESKNNELINKLDGNDNVDEDGNKLCISCKIMNDLIGTMKTLMNKLEDVNRKHCSGKYSSINKTIHDGKNRGARAMSQWIASDERGVPGGLPGSLTRPKWLSRRKNVNGQDESPSGTNQQQEPSVDREPSPSALPPRPRYRMDQQKNENTNTNFNSLGHSADFDDNNYSDKQSKNPAITQGTSRLSKDKKNLMNNENDDNNLSPTYIIDDNYDQEHGKSKNKVVFVCSRMKDNKRKRQMSEFKNSKKNSYRKNNDMSSMENNNINTNVNLNSNSNRKSRKTITPTTEMIALNSNDTVAHNETDLNNTTSANNEGTSRPM